MRVTLALHGFTHSLALLVLLGCTRVPADAALDSPAEDDSSDDSPPADTGPFDLDGDGWSTRWNDCDDSDPTVHPGATELPDGIDQNCNGEIDEDTELGDDDRDGYNEVDGDCNDADRHTFPGAVDFAPCDGIDRSCTGVEEPCRSLDDAFATVSAIDNPAVLANAVAGNVDVTGDGRADVLTFNGDLHVWEISETGGLYAWYAKVGMVYGLLPGDNDMVAVLGDTNRDGLAEVAFGNTSGRRQGYVYVVSAPLVGGINAETGSVAILTDGEESTSFGVSVDAGRDASGDGVCDILVGAPMDNEYTGSVYLVSGDVRGEVSMDVALAHIHGDVAEDGVGGGVRFSGDNNGDGIQDILIGGVGYTDRPSQVAWLAGPVAGVLSILDGDLVMIDPGLQLMGTAFSEVGDVDGDGRADLLLNTWDYCTGRVFVFTQVPSVGLDEAAARLDGDYSCGVFGSATTMLDANGDGLDDILVGDSGSQLGGYYIEPRASTLYTSGAAALFLAPFSGVRSFWDAEAVWAGEYSADTLGGDVSNAGDFNGDGFEDFLLAAPYYGDPEDSTQAFSGAAYLMLGRADW